VMAGGLMGAIAGPNLAAATRSLTAVPFAGAYLALAGVALLAMLLLAVIDFPPAPPKGPASAGGRPLSVIMRQPVFIVAASAGALGYGVMNLLMAATPIAMQICGLPFSDTALVLEWHVIGMFAPGFFTGHLIKKFGTLPIMAVGLALNAACVLIALSGVQLHQFLAALFLLGVGWNFLFIFAGCGLELSVHRQHHPGAEHLPARRKRQGPGRTEFLRVCGAGAVFIGLGRAGNHAGLDTAQSGLTATAGHDRRGPGLAGLEATAAGAGLSSQAPVRSGRPARS